MCYTLFMRIIADLHIHSRFSRATSPAITPETLAHFARVKGTDLVGTGDCTHPAWLTELREKLTEAGDGVYRCGGTRFVLTGEVSTIYKKGEKTRKVHHLVLLSGFAGAEGFQAALAKHGNIVSDGRPILGLDSRDLLELLLEADDRAVLVPAHIWTPWFSALGAKSGFDSIDECYGDLAGHITAIETGLSSNPPMNWSLSSLDRFNIISNSDAHSPDKLGREATVFDMPDVSFDALRSALAGGDGENRILETLEFFPQEGKYHVDGHRKCGAWLGGGEPGVAQKCPVCGKPFTPGVMGRVRELADRPVSDGGQPKGGANQKPYRSLVPLKEIIGEVLGVGPTSKKVAAAYDALVNADGTTGWSELAVLMDVPLAEIAARNEAIASAIGNMRAGKVTVTPGYDGEYGSVRCLA